MVCSPPFAGSVRDRRRLNSCSVAMTAGVAALGSGARGRGTGETAGGRSSAEERAAGAAAATRAAPVHSKGEEVIPVAEEELRVGKREVSGGRVRVRSYVMETPVQEQLNLRKEHVSVERRPVDRAATSGDNLFRERTIEAEERAGVIRREAALRQGAATLGGRAHQQIEHRAPDTRGKGPGRGLRRHASQDMAGHGCASIADIDEHLQ